MLKYVKNWKKSKMLLFIAVFICYTDVLLKPTQIPYIAIITSSSVQKIGLPGLLFCPLLANNISGGLKYLLFHKISVTRA